MTNYKRKDLKFKNWQDACRNLLGKLLLKNLEVLGLDISLSNLKYNTIILHYVDGNVDFYIHSGDYAVCAVSTEGGVGIDLELVRPITVNRFRSKFSENKWRLIMGSETSILFFY